MRSTPLLEVEISIVRDDCTVSKSLSKLGLKVDFINLNIGTEESSHLLKLGSDYRAVVTKLRRDGVKVSSVKRDKIIALSPSCSSCRVLARLNSVVLSAMSPKENVVIYRILTDRKSLSMISDQFEEEGLKYSVMSKETYETLSGLTSRQSEIILFALLNGYFDVRRRVNLSSIARNFSIKPATADLILRRALKKVVDAHIMRKI